MQHCQSSGKRDCRLGKEFVVWGGRRKLGGGGALPSLKETGAAACATSAHFSSQAENQPKFPGMLHPGFDAALYLIPLFSVFSFLTEL